MVSKFKDKNGKGVWIFEFGKVMFMCVLSLTLEALSATSGEHGMLQPTQSVLLDPMHNNDALVSFLSTLKPLSPTPSFLFPFFLFHHELSSSFHAQESFLLTLFFLLNATFIHGSPTPLFSHSSLPSINLYIFILIQFHCATYITSTTPCLSSVEGTSPRTSTFLLYPFPFPSSGVYYCYYPYYPSHLSPLHNLYSLELIPQEKKKHGLSLGEKQISVLFTFGVVAREYQPKGVHLDTLLVL